MYLILNSCGPERTVQVMHIYEKWSIGVRVCNGLSVSEDVWLVCPSLQLSVDTLQFLLFLYMQQLNHVSLRTSLIGEEWPSPRARSPSPSSDREAKTSSQNKVAYGLVLPDLFIHRDLPYNVNQLCLCGS